MLADLPPALLLGALLCLVYGSLYHLLTGRNLRDLGIGLLMTTIGFGLGQLAGLFTQSAFLQIGQLHVTEASLGAWLFLAVARLVGQV